MCAWEECTCSPWIYYRFKYKYLHMYIYRSREICRQFCENMLQLYTNHSFHILPIFISNSSISIFTPQVDICMFFSLASLLRKLLRKQASRPCFYLVPRIVCVKTCEWMIFLFPHMYVSASTTATSTTRTTTSIHLIMILLITFSGSQPTRLPANVPDWLNNKM